MAKARFGDPVLSDHSLGIVTVLDDWILIKMSFRFKNFWSMNEGFLDLVKGAWEGELRGSRQYILILKLKRLKEVFRGWDKRALLDLETKVKEETSRLVALHRELHDDMFNERLQEEISMIRGDLRLNMKAQSSLVKQKANVKWVKFGEETSYFFFRRVKERKAQKTFSHSPFWMVH